MSEYPWTKSSKSGTHGSASRGIGKSTIHAQYGLIDFLSALETYHNCVHQTALHCETYGFFAVLGICEIAIAYDFHSDDAVPFLTHDSDLLKHRRQMGCITLGIPKLGRGIYVRTLGIDPHQIDVNPVQPGGFRQGGH
jgi:hypothetical protein